MALVLLVAVAPTLLGGFLRGRIESAARESAKTNVAIGSLSLGWLSGLEVGDIRMEPGPKGEPGVHIASITAKPTLSALLRGRVEVPDLVVKHVTLDLTSKPKEREEKEEADEPDEPENAPPESVQGFGLKATIEDVTIVYRDPSWERPIRVDHLGPVTITASSDDASHVEVVAGPTVRASIDLLWAKDGKKLRRRQHTLSGEVTFDHTDLATFQGAVAPWADALSGVLDGKITVKALGKAIESSGSLKLARASIAMRGKAEPHRIADLVLKHDVRRNPQGPVLDGLVELGIVQADLAPLSTPGEALRIEKADLRARLAGNVKVEVERFGVQAPFGSVEGSGQFAGGKEPQSVTARLETRAAVEKLAQWLGGMPAVTGDLTSQASISIAPDGLVAVRGSTTLADFAAKDVPGVGQLREKAIVFRHDLDWGGDVLRMRDVGLTSSFTTATCTGSLQPGAAGAAPEGQVDLQLAADLDVIAGLLGEHLPVKPKGKLTAGGRITGAKDGMGFDLKLNGDRIIASGGPFEAAPLDLGKIEGRWEGRVSSDRTSVVIPKWSLRSKVAVLSGSVEAKALKNPHPAIVAGVSGTLEPDPILASCKPDLLRGRLGSIPFAAEITGNDEALHVALTKLEAAGLSVRATASLPHADVPSGAGALAASISGPIDQVMPLVSASEARVSGAIQMDVTGKMGTPYEFDLKLEAPNLTFVNVEKKRLNGAVTASAHGTFLKDTGALQLDSLTATGPGASLAGKVTLEPGKAANFDLRSDITMAEASPILAFVAPSVQGAGKGSLRANGQMSLVPDAPPTASRASFDLTLDRMETDMFDLENLAVEAALEGGVAKTKRASANLNGGTATLDATYDMRAAVPEWKAATKLDRVRITKEMQPAIARAIPLFAGLGATVSGHIGADLDVSGRGDTWEAAKPTLTGTGLLSLIGGRLAQGEILAVVGQVIGLPREVAFQDMETRFQIQNGAVRQDNLVLACAQFDVRMAGTTSFEGRLDYNLGLKPKGNLAPQWKYVLDKQGYLPMRLQGDVRKPSLKPPKPKDIIENAAEDLIKGGLDDLLKGKKKKP